jgi:hypothetical protein
MITMKFYKVHWHKWMENDTLCGNHGHKLLACKYKYKTKSDWAINKSKNKQQSHLNADSRQEAQSADAQSQFTRTTSITASSIPG